MSVAKSETINLATLVINDAIDQQIEQAESKTVSVHSEYGRLQ